MDEVLSPQPGLGCHLSSVIECPTCRSCLFPTTPVLSGGKAFEGLNNTTGKAPSLPTAPSLPSKFWAPGLQRLLFFPES